MHRISWPNRITIARILLIGPFVVALLHLQDPGWSHSARWAALGIFAIMAISDWLDGFLARRLKEESAVGRFLDPLADKLLVLFSVVLLANNGTHVTGMLLPSTVTVIAVGKDLIVILGFCIIYFGTGRVYIDPRGSGKLCTTLQLLMVIAILLSPSVPDLFSIASRVLWWCASLLAVATVVHYFQLGRLFVARHEIGEEGKERVEPEKPGPGE